MVAFLMPDVLGPCEHIRNSLPLFRRRRTTLFGLLFYLSGWRARSLSSDCCSSHMSSVANHRWRPWRETWESERIEVSLVAYKMLYDGPRPSFAKRMMSTRRMIGTGCCKSYTLPIQQYWTLPTGHDRGRPSATFDGSDLHGNATLPIIRYLCDRASDYVSMHHRHAG